MTEDVLLLQNQNFPLYKTSEVAIWSNSIKLMSAWPGMVITRIYNCIFLPADMKKGVVIVGFMKFLNMDRQLNHESIFSGIYSVQLLCQKLGKHLMNCFLLSLVECDPFHSVLIKSSYQKNIGLTEGESILFCCQYISNKTVVGKNVAGSLKKTCCISP